MAFAILTSSANSEIDIQSVVDRHLLVVGQTGSGKTTSVLALLSELQKKNQTVIVLDPTGEYTKLPNTVTYRLGENAYLAPDQLRVDELMAVLNLDWGPRLRTKLSQAILDLRIARHLCKSNGIFKRQGVLIADYQQDLRRLATWMKDYQFAKLAEQLIQEFVVPYADQRADFNYLGQELAQDQLRQNWDQIITLATRIAQPEFHKLFDYDPHPGTFKVELNYLFKQFTSQASEHRTLVIDLSLLRQYPHSQEALISTLLKRVLTLRLASNIKFPVRLVIDEAHRYLPKEADLVKNGIFQIAREGRKAHLTLILTTQSPLDLAPRLRSQFSNCLLHRITDPVEVRSLNLPKKVDSTQLLVGKGWLHCDGDEWQEIQVQLPEWLTNKNDQNKR
ncbi:ATP-binding protein [Lactobacillus sp. 3B(2020)]|uniref:ATP-binding protein n=1 Tax=Lactobacillus sp. 3B(2020) TaxID=2695882 RepID=UPI0015DF182B|nr:ATP-binding protein [Lactobacillus sp. 3B(2020)]QLL69912.1 DUF87 domain-containing protein [Lactobacillus sp. 3B(2020)]